MRHRHGLRNSIAPASIADDAAHICVLAARARAIKTTVPKAKELRRVVEPLITWARADARQPRLAFDRPRPRDRRQAVRRTGPALRRLAVTPGILKMGFRVGDNAPMAFVELVDRPRPGLPKAEAEKAESVLHRGQGTEPASLFLGVSPGVSPDQGGTPASQQCHVVRARAGSRSVRATQVAANRQNASTGG